MMKSPMETAIEKLQEALSQATSPADIAMLTEKLVAVMGMQGKGEERLLTLEMAARYIGDIKPDSLRKLCAAQKIPHIKIGSMTRFDPESLKKWLLSQEKKMHKVWRK